MRVIFLSPDHYFPSKISLLHLLNLPFSPSIQISEQITMVDPSCFRRKVRIVARIRASHDFETGSSNKFPTSQISVQKPDGKSSETVTTLSFGDQANRGKESYKFDYCYDQDEDTTQIFTREVKPILSGIFNGLNASVLVYGTRDSGKTYTIQGTEVKPGLAPLAIAEILSISEETGGSVSVSFFEMYQDHVYDILGPKGQEVLVLKDASGRIQLRGLSQVPVKSIADFYRFYFHGSTLRELAQRRSHKGLIVNVSCNNKDSDTRIVGKMNFVDLAGHEDTKRKSIDGPNHAESVRINKSLYTLHNVVYALNSNENNIPYRESKLTHMLQDSLGGTSQTLMVTCLSPSFCQDTVYTVNLASWSCQAVNRVCPDSSKKTKSGSKPTSFCSPEPGRAQTLSTSLRKHSRFQLSLTKEKTNGVSSTVVKGRKLFNGAHYINSSTQNCTQENSTSNIVSAIESSLPKEEVSISAAPKAIESSMPKEENLTVPKLTELSTSNEDLSPHNNDDDGKVTSETECETKTLTVPEEDSDMDKENKSSLIGESSSPPVSARLQELSNSMKSLYYSTPLTVNVSEEVSSLCNNQACMDLVEPKTPGVDLQKRFNDNCDVANIGTTPRGRFTMRSAGLKNSLVKEYLKFLNTASKEELKELKGIGEKRANYILELRENSPEPLKNLDDLKEIGLYSKQINAMMKQVAGELFS